MYVNDSLRYLIAISDVQKLLRLLNQVIPIIDNKSCKNIIQKVSPYLDNHHIDIFVCIMYMII